MRTRLKDTFSWVADSESRGSLADRRGWARDPEIVAGIGSALAELFPDDRPTVVLGPESSGYIYASLVAQAVGAGFVGASKERRNLRDDDKWLVATTPLDYAGRNMELSIQAKLLDGSDRVLVVDDWAATGGQLLALQVLVENAGARYLGSAVIVDGLTDHELRRRLALRSLLNIREL